MLSTQQVLQSLIDMQANAQQALPVIPNNGNPMGANNMPHNSGIVPPHMRQAQSGGGTGQPVAKPNAQSQLAERYPWLKQSASMDNIRSYLNNRRGIFQQPQQPVQPHPVAIGQPMRVDPIDNPILPTPTLPVRAQEM